MLHWPSYNQSLVRQGEILFAYDFLVIWDDLAWMNENKNGKKYKFPDSFILIIGYIRIYFHLPYINKHREGIIKATGKSLPDHPLVIHTDLQKKSKNKLDISSNRLDDDDNDGIIIAIDTVQVKGNK